MKTDTFQPSIFSLRGTDFVMLVCGKKIMHRGIKSRGDDSITFESMFFPVVIQLKPQLRVLYGVRSGHNGDAEWDACKVPISKTAGFNWSFLNRAAKNALADVYRTVSEPQIKGWDKETSFILSPEKLQSYKQGSISRNVTAWLSWDEWNAKGLTMQQRADILQGQGFKCTEKALERAAGERGL